MSKATNTPATAAVVPTDAELIEVARGFGMLAGPGQNPPDAEAVAEFAQHVIAAYSAPAQPVAPTGAARPLFWYRPRSDGGYEGPIHNDSIEDVRKQSGAWAPLYPAAAPAVQAAPAAAIYRTVGGNEIIQDGDEVIDEDCVRWIPVDRWSIGWTGMNVSKTMRRAVQGERHE